MPGRAAGQDGDVPLFHHIVAEVSSPVPRGNHPHHHPEARHDPPAQTVLHLCGPQAAEKPQLCNHSVPQVDSEALNASSTVQEGILTIPPTDATARHKQQQHWDRIYRVCNLAGSQRSILHTAASRRLGYCNIARGPWVEVPEEIHIGAHRMSMEQKLTTDFELQQKFI